MGLQCFLVESDIAFNRKHNHKHFQTHQPGRPRYHGQQLGYDTAPGIKSKVKHLYQELSPTDVLALVPGKGACCICNSKSRRLPKVNWSRHCL